MELLTEKKCLPCEKGAPVISDKRIEELKPQIPDWEIVEENSMKVLKRVFKFKNFKKALEFTTKIGELAEEENHHPSILTEWGKVTLTWVTHKIKGLHENDFTMAAKSDKIFKEVM
jgi:4a-hydroxytetrahydrobiopterin dehydratase